MFLHHDVLVIKEEPVDFGCGTGEAVEVEGDEEEDQEDRHELPGRGDWSPEPVPGVGEDGAGEVDPVVHRPAETVKLLQREILRLWTCHDMSTWQS